MNALTLIIVNDGNGDQCGYTYGERLRVARLGSTLAWGFMVHNAEEWHRAHGGEPHSIAYELEAVDELQDYYRNHLEEMGDR